MSVRPLIAALLAVAATFAVAVAPAQAADPIPVTGVDTRLALDPAAGAALTSLGVQVRPSTSATVDETGRIVFPVTGGSLTPELQGTVTHSGGLFLRKGRFGLPINVQRFTIDLTGEPKLTAELRYVGLRSDLAKLTNISVAAGAGGATVVTADVELTGFAASVLNLAFQTKALGAGFKLGTATATVTLGAAS
ncbi:MAG: hypothetical protein ACSLFR_18990 [Solirubrobacteraceae bacterium]